MRERARARMTDSMRVCKCECKRVCESMGVGELVYVFFFVVYFHPPFADPSHRGTHAMPYTVNCTMEPILLRNSCQAHGTHTCTCPSYTTTVAASRPTTSERGLAHPSCLQFSTATLGRPHPPPSALTGWTSRQPAMASRLFPVPHSLPPPPNLWGFQSSLY